MGLIRYKFGELIELTNERNVDNTYGENDAIGVNIDKVIMSMRGNILEKDFSKFHLVPPLHFAYNPRGSRKLGIGFNDTNNTYIITFNDNVFKIKECAKGIVLDRYLFMYLSRKEWDRYAEYISWGSSTEVFDWKNFCEEEIDLPPVSIQQKYVDVYNAMLENQKNYEHGLDDLRTVCEGYLDNLRAILPHKRIGDYIELSEDKNESNEYNLDNVRGVSIDKRFIETKANMKGVDLRPYYIVRPNEFAYVTVTSRNGGKISMAFNDTTETYICSSSYIVFRCKDENELLPRYLRIYFERSEFNRYARFNSWGSARETFDYTEMEEVSVPIPDISVQRAIADIFESYTNRRSINEKLKAQLKDICPILIKGSIEEARIAKEA